MCMVALDISSGLILIFDVLKKLESKTLQLHLLGRFSSIDFNNVIINISRFTNLTSNHGTQDIFLQYCHYK